MSVAVCVKPQIHTYRQTDRHTDIQTHTHIHTYIHTYICCTYIYIYTLYVCIIYIYIYIYSICMYKYASMYMCIHVCFDIAPHKAIERFKAQSSLQDTGPTTS